MKENQSDIFVTEKRIKLGLHRKEQEIKDTLYGLDEKIVSEVWSKWFIPDSSWADEPCTAVLMSHKERVQSSLSALTGEILICFYYGMDTTSETEKIPLGTRYSGILTW